MHGYVNEIEGAQIHNEIDPHDVHKVVQHLEFEPSYTFINAYDSKVIRDFLRKADETTFDDMIIYAMVGVLIILAFLVWNMNTKLVALMEYIGIGLLGGVL